MLRSLLAIKMLFVVAGFTMGQEFRLRLELISNESGDIYEWVADVRAFSTMSPGGTVVGIGGRASFSSFEELLDDITGEWTLTDFGQDEGFFTLAPIDQGIFPEVDLLAPAGGETFESGVPIETVVDTDASGTGLRVTHQNQMEVDFDLPLVTLTLFGGIDQAFATIRGRGSEFVSGLVSDIDDGDLDFPIGSNVRIASNSLGAEVLIVSDVVLGDVNCDGAVNLLDVVPFVEAINSGIYQVKADINQDGLVNLLDVSPFVELLSN